MPKLRRQTFETVIIERYRRRESSVDEALIGMYLAGVSICRVEDITEALWGARASPSRVSNLNKRIYSKIEAWWNVELPRFRGQFLGHSVCVRSSCVPSYSMGDRYPRAEWRRVGL